MKKDDEYVTILHISDIHMGGDFGFGNQSSFLFAFKRAIRKIKEEHPEFTPEFIFCTGDITSSGSHSEMETALELIKKIADATGIQYLQTIVSPGNHDIDWNETKKCKTKGVDSKDCIAKIASFLDSVRKLHDEEHLSVIRILPKLVDVKSLHKTFSIHYFSNYNLLVYNLNSNIVNSHIKENQYGYVGEDQLNNVDEFVEQKVDPAGQEKFLNAFKVVLIHHPFLAPADHDGSALRDQYFENWIREKKIDMVLHGHQHYNKSIAFQGLPESFIALGAGSIGASAANRDDSYISFNIIRIKRPHAQCRDIEILCGEFKKFRNDWDFDIKDIAPLWPSSTSSNLPSLLQPTNLEHIESLGLMGLLERLRDKIIKIEKGGNVLIDGTDSALTAYLGGIHRTNTSLIVTSFLHSQFWHNEPFSEEIIAANKALSERVNGNNGHARRLFITKSSLHSYINREVQKAFKHMREENDRTLLDQIKQGVYNLEQLTQDFEMRIIESGELPPSPVDSFDPRNYELAIYDDWRIDKFIVHKNGSIISVEIFPKTYPIFKHIQNSLVSFFEDAWDKAKFSAGGVNDYISTLKRQIDLEEKRIQYTNHWLMLFEKMVKEENSILTAESKETIKILKRHLKSKGRNRFSSYLDVGVCTARYPRLLIEHNLVDNGDFKNISTVDSDSDVEMYMGTYHSEIPFTLIDIRSEDVVNILGKKFDLITCMLGTASHFGLAGQPLWNGKTGFEQGVYNLLQLLKKDGILVLSVWSSRNTDLLPIYEKHEIDRLLNNNPNEQHIKKSSWKNGYKI